MDFLQELGLLGLFIGALLSATIIPFSSDVLLIGTLAVGVDVKIAVIVATIGNWIGGMISYYMGYLGKWEWLEKYFKVKPETLAKQKARVDRYGAPLALLSWLPIVGDLFAIALGFYRLDPKLCAIYMFIGKGLRFVVWGVLFYYSKDWILSFYN